MAGNIASSATVGATTLLFVFPLDYVRTRFANDVLNATNDGRQFEGLVDVFNKTFASDGIAGLYCGFIPSVLGIVVYRGLVFGMSDYIRPVVLTGALERNFLASFLLGWAITIATGLACYPMDTIRCRMMMRSGKVTIYFTELRPPFKVFKC